MNALLIVAHGSRRKASNQEVCQLTELLEKQDHLFDHVACAFLELCTPSIPNGLLQAIEKGATQIVVFPYFLSAGRHVVEDIPAEIAKVSLLHPQINIQLSQYLGASPDINALMLKQAKLALKIE